MPLDPTLLDSLRDWCRLSSTDDDSALEIAYESAVEELETATGWCLSAVTRTQYVFSSADLSYGSLLLLRRQPVTAATVLIAGSPVSLALVNVNGLQFADFTSSLVPGLVYPCVVTISAGGGSGGLPKLCKTLVYERVAGLVAARGDEVAQMDTTYWTRGIAAIGKGIS